MSRVRYEDAALDWGMGGERLTPTLASCDKLWTVITFEDRVEAGEYQHEMLFFTVDGDYLTYELDDDTLMWTTYAEARDFQQRLEITAYVLNWGDHAREENRIIGLRGPWADPHRLSMPAITEWRRRRVLGREAREATS